MNFKVLIVDDDQVVLFLHRQMVVKCHFHSAPVSFPNGQQALDYLLQHDHQDHSYFVLLDINMPVMNGWEFLNQLSEHTLASQVYVAIVTSSIASSDKEKAANYNQVIEYLEKPVDKEKLENLKANQYLRQFFS